MQTLPVGGEFMQTYSPPNALACSSFVGQNSLLVAIRAGRVVPRQAQPESGRGEMGWRGGARPALTAASSGARPLLFFLTLTSPCAALCVTHDYKSYSNGEDYFYLLDSTTGKLIVIRGCKEWFTFPALGKIMTQVLHP